MQSRAVQVIPVEFPGQETENATSHDHTHRDVRKRGVEGMGEANRFQEGEKRCSHGAPPCVGIKRDCFFVKKEDFIDHLPKLSLNFSKISGKKRLK